jgi:NhaP-type Na+/H+ or K+/H+ antiporter
MHVFEAILILLLCATVLSAVARRIGIPYPALLAVGGAMLAFLPGAPQIDLPPELILVLFVAPVLLDAAYDVSLRDLRANWIHVSSLILVAVGLTTGFVAVVAHYLFPAMPWAAAIALGAIVAPPDAVAALAVLRQAKPPHQIRIILEGESLLNDASALLIYRLAIGAAMAGHFTPSDALPAFAGVVFGSVAAGWALAWPIGRIAARIDNAPESVVFQFVMTFASWLIAERLGLSGVVTVVVLGVTLARKPAAVLSARIRLSSFAIWETVTMVLNVLAFVLIGLAVGPLLRRVDAAERLDMLLGGLAVLATVIVVRLVWTFVYDAVLRSLAPRAGSDAMRPDAKGGLIVGWSGIATSRRNWIGGS